MKLRLHRGLLSTGAVALATVFVLPFGHAAATSQPPAQSHAAGVPIAPSNDINASRAARAVPSIRIQSKAAASLFLSSPRRQTHVHLMPTTAWLREHSNFSSVEKETLSAPPAAGIPPLAAPECTLATDSSPGDATPSPPGIGTEGSFDSLDMTAVGLGTANGDLVAQIRVVSLTKSGGEPDMGPGQPDNWFVQWSSGGTLYYLRAQYAGGNAATTTVFTYGTIKTEAVETLHVPSGSATGTMNLANNLITISVPLSSVGSPASGAALKSIFFETDVQVGSPLYVADSQTAQADYKIGETGATCPALSSPATALPGPVPTQGAPTNLTHYGGPVVHHITNYLIFWLPSLGTTSHPSPSGANATGPSTTSSSVSCLEPGVKNYNYEPGLPTDPGTDQSYEKILEQYFKDLPGTSFYNLLTQYADQGNGPVSNDPAFGGVYFDTCGYSSTPASGVSVPGGTAAAPLYDVDIQNEVLAAMKVNGWKTGLDKEYFVYTGYDAASCFGPPSPGTPEPTCSVQGAPPAYCAYHGDFIDSGTPVLYANMADGYYAGTKTLGLCYSSPIGTTAGVPHKIGTTTYHDWAADAEVAITSHEESETVTDAMVGTAQNYAPPLGWYSSPNDQADGEIGDKCAYIYGKYRSDGSNITLANGDEYIVQLEYSNWANGCSVGDASVAPGPYGGVSDKVTLLKGWNLIDLPTGAFSSAESLEDSIEALSGKENESLIGEIATFNNGRFTVTIPDVNNQPLTRNEGIFVYMTSGPNVWTPPGTAYTTPAAIHLGTGWNLIGATWPNPGVMTDSMFNQIETANHSCVIDSGYLDPNCSPSVNAIVTYAPTFDSSGNVTGAQYQGWLPVPAFTKAAATGWVQARTVNGVALTGNQVPFTSGMWVRALTPLTWTPQGTECQTIVNGMCK